jgi:hypothetical protein
VEEKQVAYPYQEINNTYWCMLTRDTYTNRTTNSRGQKVFAYRMGNPSRQFEKYLDQGQIARARKTLYRNAISVSMG